MNDLSKNHDQWVCQEAQPPQYPIRIIGLKGILLYWLNRFLSGNYEEKRKSFTDFSYNSKAVPGPDLQLGTFAGTSVSIDWSRVPIQKHPIETSVLYTSALPKIISIGNARPSGLSQKVKTQKIVNQLNQFQMHSSKQYLKAEDAILRFLSDIWHEFEISSDRSGWISFQLSESGIAKWLQHLIKNDLMLETCHTLVIHQLSAGYSALPPASITQKQSSENVDISIEATAVDRRLWPVQHTYARCCSLIHRCTNTCVYTTPLGQQQNSQAQNSQTSQQLLQQLIAMGDAMFWIPYRYPSKQYLLFLKAANQLCQSFERFQKEDLPGLSCCGASTRSRPYHHSPTPHCDLIIATRNMLKPLLQSAFRVTAPEAL